MKPSKTCLVVLCLFLLATVPAYCQRGTVGIDLGQVSDRFAGLASNSGLEAGVDGQITIIKGNQREGRPSIVAGGELRAPTDATNHAKEYAVYGGLVFHVHNNFSIGVDGQVRKIYLPPSTVDNQVFNRDKMELFQLPLVIKYNFWREKRAFVQVQGEPEFSPRFRSSSALYELPNPNFDHAYTLRGTAGYNFGKSYYVKASYETRYFKFTENQNNPNGLYNWKSNLITAGVGFIF